MLFLNHRKYFNMYSDFLLVYMGSCRIQQRKPHLDHTSSRRTLGLQKWTNMGNERKKFSRVPRTKNAGAKRRASVYEGEESRRRHYPQSGAERSTRQRCAVRWPRGFRSMLRQNAAQAGLKPCTRSRCGNRNWRVAMRFYFPRDLDRGERVLGERDQACG